MLPRISGLGQFLFGLPALIPILAHFSSSLRVGKLAALNRGIIFLWPRIRYEQAVQCLSR